MLPARLESARLESAGLQSARLESAGLQSARLEPARLLLAGLWCAGVVGVAIAGCGPNGRHRASRGERWEGGAVWRGPAPGSRGAPLPVMAGRLPLLERRDLDLGAQGTLARDPCAPGFRLPGPEVWYEVWPDAPAVLHAALTADSSLGARVILIGPSGRCLASGARRAARRVDRGPVQVVVDTRARGGGRVTVSLWQEADTPVALGSAWITHYYLAQEGDHEGEPLDAPLLSPDCTILADVPRAFHDDLCIEGSGQLRDGRVLNYASTCTRACFAAVRCGRRAVKTCYRVLDRDRYPWGMGAGGRPLVPDRSVAVDPSVVDLGTVLYVPELDGMVPPGRSTPHDGCVRADDVGGAIRGLHIDFFAATRARWRAWERILPTRSFVTLIAHDPHCQALAGVAGWDGVQDAHPGGTGAPREGAP